MESSAYKWLVSQYRHVLNRMRVHEFMEEHPQVAVSRRAAGPAFTAPRLRLEQLENRVMLATTVTGVPNWIEQGPGPMQGGQVRGITNTPVTGAIHAVVADPDLAQAGTIWVGTVGGGIWKTTDGGVNWAPKTDQFPSTTISALAIDPVNQNVMWAGTGKVSSSGLGGKTIGLLKSSDGGETWRIYPSIFERDRTIHAIVPTTVAQGPSGRVLLVGSDATPQFANAPAGRVSGGLIRSTDGGFGGFKKISGNINDGLDNDNDGSKDEADEDTGLPGGTVTDIKADPGNPNRFYLAMPGKGVFVSNDAGLTWSELNTALALAGAATANTTKIELAVSPTTAPNGNHVLYAAMIEDVQDSLIGAARPAPNQVDVSLNTLITAGDNVWVYDAAGNAVDFRKVTATATVGGNTRLTFQSNLTVAHAAGNFIWRGGKRVAGIYRSADHGGTWQSVGRPGDANGGIHPGGQAENHFSMLVNRTNPNIIYVGGDRQPALPGPDTIIGTPDDTFPNTVGAVNFTGRLFAGTFNTVAGTTAWTPITDNGATGGGAANLGTAPHADSRMMIYDANNDILEVDDGGIYRLDNPGANQIWQSVNGNLRLTEFYSVAVNATNGRILGGTQDNGVAFQGPLPTVTWQNLAQGDGGIVASSNGVNYYSSQNFGGFTIGAAKPALKVLGTGATQAARLPLDNKFDSTLQFVQPYVVNSVALNRLLIGTDFLYETDAVGSNLGDQLTLLGGNPTAGGTAGFVPNPAAKVGKVRPNAMVYGGMEGLTPKPDVGWVGTDGSAGNAGGDYLFLRQAGAKTKFHAVKSWTTAEGTQKAPNTRIVALAVDPTDWRHIYVLDAKGRIWFSDDGAKDPAAKMDNVTVPAPANKWQWTELTKLSNNLLTVPGATNLQDIAIHRSGTKRVILVGGDGGVFRRIDDVGGSPTTGMWHEYGGGPLLNGVAVPRGGGLPNAMVSDIKLSSGNQVVVGTMGRGAFTTPTADLITPGAVTVTGTAGNDVLKLRRDAQRPWLLNIYEYIVGSAEPAPSTVVPLSSINNIFIDGGAGDDEIVVDYSNGAISVPDGIIVAGGDDNDSLSFPIPSSAARKATSKKVDNLGPLFQSTITSKDAFGVTATQKVSWSSTTIETAPAAVQLASAINVVGSGLQLASTSLQHGLSSVSGGTGLAGLDAQSLAAAMSGVRVNQPRPKDDAFLSVTEVADTEKVQLDNATSVLRRLIEEGLNGFELNDIDEEEGTITDLNALRDALDALDSTAGNVTLNTTTNDNDGDGTMDPTFTLQILDRPLDGIVNLDIEATSAIGEVQLNGAMEVTADVTLNVVFGVDAEGFFLKPSAAGTPAIRLENFDINGAVNARGRLGFLGVDMKDATLTVDPGVGVEFSFADPGTGADADGSIRLTELDPADYADLIDINIDNNPGGPADVVIDGTFAVSALLPGVSSGITLLDGDVKLSWADLGDPTTVVISATPGSAGAKLLDFMEVTGQQVLDQLKALRGHIDLLAATPLKSSLPLLKDGLDTIIDVIEAIDTKLINPLSEAGGGVSTRFFTAQELAVMLASELGLDLSTLNLSYNSSNGELTMHIDFSHVFASASTPLAFQLGLQEGLAIDSSFNGAVDAHFGFAFDLGVDIGGLVGGGDVEDNIFIRNASINAGVDINITDLDVVARLGFLDLEVVNGTLVADPSLTINLVDPDTNSDSASDGRIDLSELLGAPASAIGSPALSGIVALQLPLKATFLGIDPFDDGAGDPNNDDTSTTIGVTITFGPSGGGIAVNLPSSLDFADMLNFTNMDAASMAGLLGKLTFWMDEFRRSDEFKKLDLPLIGPALDQVLEFADAFRDKVLIDDSDDDIDGTNTLLNDINAALAQAGIGDKVRAENDGGKIRLIANDATLTTGFTVTSSAPLGFGAQSSTKPTGAYFHSILASAVPTGTDGKITSKATFSLAFDGGDPIEVRLYKAIGPAPFDGSGVSAVNDTITITGHQLSTGDVVKYSTGGGTLIPGLTNGATYFVIHAGPNAVKLATSLANATAVTPVPVNITGAGAGALHTLSHPYNTDDNTAIGNDQWKLVNADNAATFDTVQEMIPKLGAIFGVPGLSYDKNTDVLTFSLNLNQTFGTLDLPIDFNFDDLEPLLGLQSSGSIRLSANGTFNLTVGVYLGDAPPSTKLTGNEKVKTLNGGINIKTDELITAPNDVKSEYGRLTDDAAFKVFINSDAAVDVTLAKTLTDNNNTIADLVGDINARLTVAGLNTKVVAEADGLKVVLRGIGSTTALKVTSESTKPAVREIGLPADRSAVLTDGVVKIVGQDLLPVAVGKLAANAVFNLSVSTISGGAAQQITVNSTDTATNRNLLDVIADVQKAIDAVVGAGKIVVASSGRRLTFAATDAAASNFSITAVAGTPAVTVLGLAPSNLGNSNEFIITLRNNTKHGVELDSLAADPNADLNDLMAKIISEVGAANIDVQIDTKQFGLRLQDKTTGSAMFKVEMANGSTAAIDLGILKQDAPEPLEGVDTEDPDGFIDGSPIGGIKLTDRFFIQTANVNVGLSLSTPTDVTGSAKFGFVGIGLEGGGSATASFTMGLKDPKTVADDNRITLTELIDNLDDISKFVATPALTGTGSFALDVSLTPDLPGLDFESGGTPQIVFTINTLGDPFLGSTFKEKNYERLSNTSFRLDGDLTGKLPVGATMNFVVLDGNDNEVSFDLKVVSRSFAGGKTTVNVGPAETGGTATPLPASVTDDNFVSATLAPDVDLTFPDIGDLLDFENLGFNFQTIIEGLKTLSEFLGQFESFGFLNDPIPLVNVSVNELIGVADKFAQAVEEAEKNPAGTIQLLEDKIKEAFGIPLTGLGSDLINLELVNDDNDNNPTGNDNPNDDFQILKLDVNLAAAFNESLNVDLSIGDGLSLGGAADLNATGAIDLKLELGLRLDDPTEIYIFEDTGLSGTLNLSGSNLTFNAAAGPVGIFVQGGSASINGTAAGGKLFTASLDDAPFVNGRIAITDPSFDLGDAFTAQVAATAILSLPVYFPTQSKFAGTIGFNGTIGIDANTKKLTISGAGLTAKDETGTTVPNVADLFEIDFSQFSVLDGLLLGVDGVDLFLEGLQDLLGGDLFGFELPLIGDKFSDAADVIGDFREGFVQKFREAMEDFANPAQAYTAFAESAAASAAAAAGGAAAAGDDADPISKMLFELLGSTGLGLLKDGPDAGTDISVSDILFASNINEPGITPAELSFDWDFDIGDTIEAGAGIGFDVGIPGLGLETTGEIDFDLDWELGLGFGINADDGFYFDIANKDEFGVKHPELELNVDVTVPGGGITGTLGFLQLTAKDNPNNDGTATHLGATFGIDIFSSSDTPTVKDEKLSFSELGRIDVSAGLAAEAVVDLGAKLSLSSDLIPGAATNFPSIVADFRLEWELGNRTNGTLVDLTTLDGSFLENGLKFVGFEHVGLDLGSYFSDLVGPIVEKVKDITDPIKPFLDFLTTPIPVISDLAGPTTLLDIAALSGAINPGLIAALETIDQVVDIVDMVSGIGDVILYFDAVFPESAGMFVIYDAEAEGGDAALPDLKNPNLDLSGLTKNLAWADGALGDALEFIGGLAEEGLNKMLPGGAASTGFSMPIIDDPSQIFGMLMGQPAVLVQYDMAPLGVKADFSAFFSIFGPLGVSINAEFEALIDFSFGYDTQGVQDFAASDFRNPELLFNGFFVGDMDAAGKVDVAELQFDAGLWAAAELNLGIARGGVGGGLFAEIDFNLHDPNEDGRIRLSELATNFLNEFNHGSKILSPLAIFDVTGSLTARLFAFLKIDLGFFTLDKKFDITPPLELLNFNLPFERFPTLATELPGGVLQLNMGQFAAERIEGDKTDGAEEFHVKPAGAGKVAVWAPSLGVDEGEAQEYDVTSRIIALGGEGNDTIDLHLVDGTIAFEIEGGSGDDTILAGTTATGDGRILGGGGNDTITGGGGHDVIFGEAGNDSIDGGGGKDWVFGDGDVDEAIQEVLDQTDEETPLIGYNIAVEAKLNDGNDTLKGGAESDLVIGGGGTDSIEGGAANDVLIGDGAEVEVGLDKVTVADDPTDPAVEDSQGTKDAADNIKGDAGADRIFAGGGNDTLSGGTENDEIHGQGGTDSIAGDAGNDSILAGEQNDTVTGGDNNDTILGEEGHDSILGGGENDSISGGTGVDTLGGEGGDDDITGDAEPDVITGGDGDDFLEGGGSNDLVTGGIGNDTLVAGYGSDVIDGQDGSDSYTIAARGGSTTELTTAYDSGPLADTDILTVDGTAEDDTFLLRAMADAYFPGEARLLAFVEKILRSDKEGKRELLTEGITNLYGTFDVPDGMLAAVEEAFDDHPIDNTNATTLENSTVAAINAVQDEISDHYVEETLTLILKKLDKIFDSGITGDALLDAMKQAIVDLYAPTTAPADMITDLEAAFDDDETDIDGFKQAVEDNYVEYSGDFTGQNTAFVALINDGGADVERFNYRDMEGLVLNTADGNDYVASDDAMAVATINLGIGNDRVQIGQVYASPRDDNPISANIAEDDAFGTVAITRGFLSAGVSEPTVVNGGDGADEMTVFHNTAVLNLNGGDGDDLFTVRAFALAGSTDSERARTDMKGDGGADTIRYALNAPVGIDGGDGFDTIRIVGTEFSDDFVVTDSGVFGAGLNVSYVNIEKLIADGAEGDDRFFILSTGLDVVTEIDGGLGSDSFFAGGAPGDAPISVISDDFKGHSGIITHNVESTDPSYDKLKADGVSANVADDEERFIIVTESGGSSSVTENATSGGLGIVEDTYKVRLSRKPADGKNVRIKLVDAGLPPEDQARKFKDLQFWNGFTWVDAQFHPGLLFTSSNNNWKNGLEVKFRATSDAASEGERFTFINHTTKNSTDPLFAEAKMLMVKVRITDDDRASVVITGTDGNNTVLENGFTDKIKVVLTRQPTHDVTVNLQTLNGQVTLSDTSLDFDDSNWNVPQEVTVTAAGDTVVEGFHTDFITATVSSEDVDVQKPQALYTVDANPSKPGLQEIPQANKTSYLFLEHRPDLSAPVTILHDADGAAGLGSPVVVQPFNGETDPELRYSIVGNTLRFHKNGNAAQISGRVQASYKYIERGYNNLLVKDTVVDVYDDDTPMVIVRQSNGSTDVIEGPDGATDAYTVVLSKAPAAGKTVTIKVDAIKTRTTLEGDPEFQEQVTVDGASETTLTFTDSNWDVPQEITVGAKHDTKQDGSETQVFAPQVATINKIRGPLIIEGAAGAGSLSLPAPLMLPGELNVREATGNVVAFTPSTGGGAIETMTVVTQDLLDHLDDVEVADLAGLKGKTIELTSGPGTDVILDAERPRDLYDRFWLITKVEDAGGGNTTLTLQNPTMVDPGNSNVTAPTTETKYAITALSINFFADEREQVDYATVYDQESVADETGLLTSSDGNVLGFTASASDPETMLVETGDLQKLGLANNDLNLLEGKIIEITVGPGRGRKWTVDEVVNQTDNNVKLLKLIKVAGTGSTAPTNRSEFRVDGFDRHGRIVGFGMGPNVVIGGGVQPGGITYGDMEVLQVNLGRGKDTIDVDYATNSEGHTTKRSGDFYTLTMLNLGAGNDTVNAKVQLGQDGDLVIKGEAGNDTINAGGSTSPITAFGEEGNDTITGGSGQDTLFGDFGRIDKVDTEGLITTRLGHSLPLNPVNPPVESATATTITDSTANFETDYGGLVGLQVQVIMPDGSVQFRRIVSNTSDTITVDHAWDTMPVTGQIEEDENSAYRISMLPEDQTDGSFRDAKVVWSVENDQGGDDKIYGGGEDDIVIGGTGGDALDGGGDQDLIFGDNVRLDSNPASADAIKGRFRTVAGATMYDANGAAQVNAAAAHLVPAALLPSWANWTITLDQTALNFGNDYVAGGAGNDQIFGQLGNDTVQGDGSIDLVVSATAASVEDHNGVGTDGDDYIEGNAGNDLLFGNLGQDDLVGGSSNMFSLTTPALRADGADVIFGGAGTDTARNNLGDTANTGHARDADFIIGDNGNIYRLVDGAGNYRTFTYDNYSTATRLIPRSVQHLDYTLGGNAVTDIGGADLVHGESGDDSIHGTVGNDVLFGEGQDDDIIGGVGSDRIYGGAGEDGILGDDGLIYTSRNGRTETLHGLTAVNAMTNIVLPGPSTGAWGYITGRLNKAVKLLAWTQGGNDVMYGGLGDDFMHGGQGNDAISGAEAVAAFYNDAPVVNVNPLSYDPVTRKLAGFDANNPRAKIANFLLNFDASTGGVKIEDGKDRIFGDLGHDWLMGGTGKDRIFGGTGDDVMNADDNLDSPGGNDTPDAAAYADADFVYGGDGLDVLIGNTGKDRLYDWSGEFNSFFVPFSVFGNPTVNRFILPGVPEWLLAMGKESGADQSRVEPDGELGLFTQGDPQWNNNTGKPRDPQPGTTKSKVDSNGGPEDDRNTALPL